MKKITFFSLFLTLNSVVFPQSSFISVLHEDNAYIHIYTTFQNVNNEILLTGAMLDSTTEDIGSFIVKLSGTGDVLQKKISWVEDSFLIAKDIFCLENGNYLLLSNLSLKEDHKKANYLILSELSENLNTISEKKIAFPSDDMYISNSRMKQVSNDEILIYGICHTIDGSGLFDWGVYLYKMNTAGDSLLFQITPGVVADLEVQNEKIYYTGPIWSDQITQLNYSDFSVTETIVLSELLGYPFLNKGYIEFLSDSSLSLFGGNILTERHSLYLLDSDFCILDSIQNIGIDTIPNHGQVLQYNSLDVDTDDNIYTAVEYYGMAVLITKTDKDLNILWESIFVSKEFTTWSFLIASHNGGFIMLGDMDNDIIIIKSDNNGTITKASDELIKIKPTELLLYPNPGSTQLNIRTAVQATGGTFYLYDLQGRLVLSKTIANTHTQIQTDKLAPGSYIYQYILKGELRESGKWVKN